MHEVVVVPIGLWSPATVAGGSFYSDGTKGQFGPFLGTVICQHRQSPLHSRRKLTNLFSNRLSPRSSNVWQRAWCLAIWRVIQGAPPPQCLVIARQHLALFTAFFGSASTEHPDTDVHKVFQVAYKVLGEQLSLAECTNYSKEILTQALGLSAIAEKAMKRSAALLSNQLRAMDCKVITLPFGKFFIGCSIIIIKFPPSRHLSCTETGSIALNGSYFLMDSITYSVLTVLFLKEHPKRRSQELFTCCLAWFEPRLSIPLTIRRGPKRAVQYMPAGLPSN